jgi:hypothetical protein
MDFPSAVVPITNGCQVGLFEQSARKRTHRDRVLLGCGDKTVRPNGTRPFPVGGIGRQSACFARQSNGPAVNGRRPRWASSTGTARIPVVPIIGHRERVIGRLPLLGPES